ncbi:nucleotide exchange factor GrpE, partial [bacterium]|nr:nucleotide exchange factor GrpE [bacterium]
PVLDNFDVATKFVPENLDDKLRNWVTGILFIRTQLETAITGMGMVAYGEVGDAFDANLHEALGGEGAVVSEVVARGWKIGEKIIRPAKVIIAK